MNQVAEENLPFILSSYEDSETDEPSELLTNKVKSKKKKKSFGKSNKESMETINKSIKKETNSRELQDAEDVPEIKRNKWRTVVINVGGVLYRSRISNFSKYPASRLGKIFRAKTSAEILGHCDGYKPGNPPVIFFDRNDQNFSAIIDSYRMGELHVCAQNCSLVTQVGEEKNLLKSDNLFEGGSRFLGHRRALPSGVLLAEILFSDIKLSE